MILVICEIIDFISGRNIIKSLKHFILYNSTQGGQAFQLLKGAVINKDP